MARGGNRVSTPLWLENPEVGNGIGCGLEEAHTGHKKESVCRPVWKGREVTMIPFLVAEDHFGCWVDNRPRRQERAQKPSSCSYLSEMLGWLAQKCQWRGCGDRRSWSIF